jgi:hypothetical protein
MCGITESKNKVISFLSVLIRKKNEMKLCFCFSTHLTAGTKTNLTA